MLVQEIFPTFHNKAEFVGTHDPLQRFLIPNAHQ